MRIIFNEDSWMWYVLSPKNECLAVVDDPALANILAGTYQAIEDAYYNSVDYQEEQSIAHSLVGRYL